jgi:ABC-type transport system substrate-binding protein/class 3 adenylate cyclase
VSELRSGFALAGYRIEALLGSGSMGSVYSALDVELDRRVAVKVLLPELARDERFRERFLRESRLAAGLEHPNVVPIHAAGESDRRLYLIMRYVDGRDLAATLQSLRRLDPDRALDIVDQVGGALDAAHARGLVHRDVKPANILLARREGDHPEHVYLCDFGLAKHASTVSSLSGERGIVGTVDYLAPEQIEGKPVDGRTDVYALGCVLYECLCGRPPYARQNELAALMAHVSEPPPRVTDSDPELPAGLDDVVAAALARERDARYATCAELVAAARTAMAGREVEPPRPSRETAMVRTFVFADIRGYTSYTREHGDEASVALAEDFTAIAAEASPAHGGHLQQMRGDGALLVFDSARQGLRFAVDLQRRVAAAALPRGIGVGLDAGEAVAVEATYLGSALNRAARLCALARAGEVLATEAVAELAGRADGFAYGLHRLERLKGFDRPVRVVEVHPDGDAPHGDRLRRLRRAVAGTRPRLRLAALAILAVLAGAIALLSGGGDDDARGVSFRPGGIGLLDARTLKPVGSVDRVGAPDGIWREPAGNIWTIDLAGRLASRIDPRTRRVTARVPLAGIEPGYPTFGAGSLWVGDFAAPRVARYDPRYGALTARIRLPAGGLATPDFTNGVAFGAGSLWASYGKWPFRVARIDPRTERVVDTLDLRDADGQALLAFGGGALWVVSQDTGRFWKIDPATNSVVGRGRLHDGWVEDAAFIGGSLWLPIQDDAAVWQVDDSANIVRSLPTGDKPYALGDGGRQVFVANQNGGTISRIDGRSGRVSTVRVGHMPNTAAVAGGLVWVSLTPSAADARRGLDPRTTVRMVTQGDPWFTTDPAVSFPGAQWQLHRAIGARLQRLPDGPEATTGRLLPEIADLPAVSDGGRTYTFPIREGYRFSPPSGAPVTAETMRATIERALSPVFTGNVVDPSLFVADIVGLDAYRARRAPHISGVRVEGDSLRITLRRPAPDFPARISLPYFSAVPLGTPARAHGIDQPLPSAGPYYLASHIGDSQEVLRRNPNYRGPRPHRVGAFLVSNAVARERAVELVLSGRADVAFPPENSINGGAAGAWRPGGDLDRRFGRGAPDGGPQFIMAAVPGVSFLGFNKRRGIFRDPVLRRAVSLAIDRRALARARGDQPWASLLPPGIPGAPDPDAAVPAPQLERAKALARGRGGRALMIVHSPDRCYSCAAVGALVRRQLAPLGIRLEVRPGRDASGIFEPDRRADIVEVGWLYDWPDPSNVLNGVFDPGRPLGYGYPGSKQPYDDPGAARAVRAAYRVAGPGRGAAYRRADAQILRGTSPPVVMFSHPVQPTLLGRRVGCASTMPQDLGLVNLAALCVS